MESSVEVIDSSIPNNSVNESSLQPTTSGSKYSKYPLPSYLLKSYWWAYLSPVGVKIFDRPWMVNAILWGQYNKIARDSASWIAAKPNQIVASVSCAYGTFFPWLAKKDNVKQLSVFDIAPIQLQSVRNKISAENLTDKCNFFIANAEQIPLASDHADCGVLYFLLHELPAEARAKVIAQTLRVVKKGGRLVIADYAPMKHPHLYHNSKFFRGIFEGLEPYLGNFWRCDLIEELKVTAEKQGKKITLVNEKYYFKKFYRLLEFNVE
ncbi:MAG: class I SAM-dependent methyltransferase [Colwellia sp.]